MCGNSPVWQKQPATLARGLALTCLQDAWAGAGQRESQMASELDSFCFLYDSVYFFTLPKPKQHEEVGRGPLWAPPPSSYCACPSHAPAVLDGVTPNQGAVAACRLADLAGAHWAAGAPRSLKTKARDERQWGCQWGLEGKVLLLWPRGPALLRVKCLIRPLLIREAGHAGGFGGHGRHHHGHRPEAQGEVPRMQSEWAGPRGPARGMGAPRDTTPRRSDQPDAGERV